MADPICRWRNATPETVRQFVHELPHEQMSSRDFRNYMKSSSFGDGFFHTPYQLACQLGLYVETNIYIPRFHHDISIEDATNYLKFWFSKYYVPNPYTKQGFKNLANPIFVEQTIYDYVKVNGDSEDVLQICKKIFKEEIGNPDIFINAINRYSTKIHITNNKFEVIKQEENNMETKNDRNDKEAFFFNFNINIPHSHNRIIFGAPGTGKSYQFKEEQEKYFDENHFERVTFHPNYSYAQFVGVYKPKMKKENGTETISYSFVPGAFLRVLIKAIKSQQENTNEAYLLLIEEINRANVAAIFGDVFQLLDRKNGESEYRIALTEDIKNYLDNLPAEEKINISDLYIPSNMYIWATMNSADQGVMPLDAAFKRRWNFEYLNIDANENGVKNIEIPNNKNDDDSYNFVKWNLFRKALNNKLKNEPSLNVNEDKLLGPFFISLKDLQNAKTEPEKFIELFKSKVLMYLFEDVCKMNPKALFTGIDIDGRIHYSDVCKQFDDKGVGIFGFDEEELSKTE